MRFFFRHPVLSGLKCSDCAKFAHNIPSGLPETFDNDDGKGPQMIERPPNAILPCMLPESVCPKGSPDNEENCRPNAANWKLVELYRRLQAPGYEVPAHLKGDRLFAENYALVKEIMEDAESERRDANLVRELANILMRRR